MSTTNQSTDLRDAMESLAIEAHREQTRNGGRLPYAVHVLSVGRIIDDAFAATGELAADPAQLCDVVLGAIGHDLYEDTKVTPTAIRARFGARVDALIEGMTNRAGDHDHTGYVARMAGQIEGVRLIKIADLVDNVTSCAYGIHDLGASWIRATFLPIVTGMVRTVRSVGYPQFPRTAALLLQWLDFALARLHANLAISVTVATVLDPQAADRIAQQQNTVKLEGDFQAAVDGTREKERLEGTVYRGAPAFVATTTEAPKREGNGRDE
jgi:hypothetical protein